MWLCWSLKAYHYHLFGLCPKFVPFWPDVHIGDSFLCNIYVRWPGNISLQLFQSQLRKLRQGNASTLACQEIKNSTLYQIFVMERLTWPGNPRLISPLYFDRRGKQSGNTALHFSMWVNYECCLKCFHLFM